MKFSFKRFFRTTGFASALFTLVLGGIAIRYLIGSEEAQDWHWWQFLYFEDYGLGFFFFEAFLLSFVLGLIPALLKWKKTSLMLVWLGLWIFLTYVLADTFVYAQYRTHLNGAMLQMTFFGGGQIVSFSWLMILQIAGFILLCAAGVGAVLWSGYWLAGTKVKVWPLFLIFFLCHLTANLTYGLSFAKQYRPITSIPEYLPLNSPIRFNKILEKVGYLTEEDAVKTQFSATVKKGKMVYPLNPLDCTAVTKKYNIVFILVDALRADMLNETNMPLTSQFAKDSVVFKNHYSTGNNTRHGIFGLFTGLPGSYWNASLRSGTPSVLTRALQESGYKIGIFTGAPLTMPEFNATIFSNIPDLRTIARGSTPLQRDQFAIEDFEAWQKQLPKDQPFFSFIFLDNVHGYSWPDKGKNDKFTPYWDNINQMELSNSFDPVPYFNSYKNAVLWADHNVGYLVDYLKKQDLLKNTIVVISSDHGEEFNDNKLNYWGHGGNFSPAQTKVPMIIRWPGKQPEEIDYVTSMLDIVPTLIPKVLGCKNPITDYSVGQDLFEKPRKKDWVYVDGWDRRGFMEPNRVVILNKAGILEYKDHGYRASGDKSVPNYYPQVLEESRRFLR